jgi:hypothetical protein
MFAETPDHVARAVAFLRGRLLVSAELLRAMSWGEVRDVATLHERRGRSELGHIDLKRPVLAPHHVVLVARLLDWPVSEVYPRRPGGPRFAPDLEAVLGEVSPSMLEAELEDAVASGAVRGRAHALADRQTALELLLRIGDVAVDPRWLLLRAVPVVPLPGSHLDRLYERLLAANDTGHGEALERAVDELFAAFASIGELPPDVPVEALPTHRVDLVLPDACVVEPTFETASGRFSAGTAWVLEEPGTTAGQGRAGRLAITCLHLFGPAGGLRAQVTAEELPSFLHTTTLHEAHDGRLVGTAERALRLEADADLASRDVAALPLHDVRCGRGLRLADHDAATAERVYLAARLRGTPPTQRLHPAVAAFSAAVLFEATSIELAGASGAPVVREDGTVVGMFVRFGRTDRGKLSGSLLPASKLRELLRRA